VWVDSGRDLSLSPRGPWHPDRSRDNSYFLPTRLYKPGVSLKDHSKPQTSNGAAIPATSKQSVSLLPFLYGKSLNPYAMCLDPFYALNELFTFVAQSENQFLNLVESIVDRSTSGNIENVAKSLLDNQADLLYHIRILGQHIARIRDTAEIIKSRADLDWPKYREGQASTATRWLERDYDHILQRSVLLQQRCEREMDMLMTRASLEESRASVIQAHRVTRLTILAFFFLPLSFSTSIFGMNFVTFPRFIDGIWVWVVVMVPLLIISFSVVSWDKTQIKRWSHSVTGKWEKQPNKALL
jgi:hypothetical protein